MEITGILAQEKQKQVVPSCLAWAGQAAELFSAWILGSVPG